MSATPTWANCRLRSEHHHEHDGIRYRVVEQPRKRYPAKPLRRIRTPVAAPDPDEAFAPLSDEHAAMAERVLRAGVRGRRRWATLRRRAGAQFSPLIVETELFDELCRHAGLIVEDVWRTERWMVDAFRVEESVRGWLGLIDPEQLRADLDEELSRPLLRAALETGPPAGVDWRSFAFVLRAGERVLELAEHEVMPSARELAGLVDHTKAWTPRRRLLLAELLGAPFEQLVAVLDRQLGVRGPLTHPQGGLWASAIGTVDIAVLEHARGIVLVENLETFRTLSALAEDGWIVVHVPGGPPPAECELVARLAVLAPQLPVEAAFDLDPAGIRIARLLQDRASVELGTAAMTPALLRDADQRLELNGWDHDQLQRLDGNAGPFETLRREITAIGAKVEQETFQRRLLTMFAVQPNDG
jgi:Protein of unknown function C-terminus (DUF2399)